MNYLALLAVAGAASAAVAQDTSNPLDRLSHAWEDDRAWYDGKAECAVYDATRTVYGQPRSYTAKIYTNKEVADAEPTFTKSSDNKGREVFKHHVREDIPTENYEYHYSTMSYVGTRDFKSLKLEMGSIEDCGATFKQYINHAPRAIPGSAETPVSTVRWLQSSYFPDEGVKQGTYNPPAGFVYEDALTVVLRGYPFDQPVETLTLAVLPDQTSNKLSPSEPVDMAVAYGGRETLDLPLGSVETHRLEVQPATEGAKARQYWFAADPKLQHILVQYDDGQGQTYKLREVERRAYWERH